MDLSMSPAQAAYDARMPDEDEDDRLTEESAAEVAQAELDRTPAVIADWLHNECCAEVDALYTAKYDDMPYSEACTEVILVSLMTCDRDRMQSWVYALREKFSLACDANGSCKARADELLAADERDRVRAAESAAADRFQQREAEMAAWEDRREH